LTAEFDLKLSVWNPTLRKKREGWGTRRLMTEPKSENEELIPLLPRDAKEV
jgi:hypothetical protein